MRLLTLLILVVGVPASGFAQGTGTLAGRVVDEFDSQGLPGANVIVEGTTLGAATDLDGNYRIIGVPVGVYDVTARFVGYVATTETGLEVNSGYTTEVDFELADDTIVAEYEPSCHYYGRPLHWRDAYAPKGFWRKDYCSISLENLPVGR